MQFANFTSNHASSSVTSIFKMEISIRKWLEDWNSEWADTWENTPFHLLHSRLNFLDCPGSSTSWDLLKNLLNQFTEAKPGPINPKTGRLRAERHLNHTVPVGIHIVPQKSPNWEMAASCFMQCIYFPTNFSNFNVSFELCRYWSLSGRAPFLIHSLSHRSREFLMLVFTLRLLQHKWCHDAQDVWDSYTGPGHIIASILWMGRCIIVILQGDRVFSVLFFTFMCFNYVSVSFLHPRLVHGS